MGDFQMVKSWTTQLFAVVIIASLTSPAQIQMILEWGPVIDVFAEALYERITLLSEFAFRLVRPRLLSDMRLNKFLSREITSPVSAGKTI